tara:strand:- start:1341 stop:1658 length:318 start_codon:yes stop_codon:yes gene_type:complete
LGKSGTFSPPKKFIICVPGTAMSALSGYTALTAIHGGMQMLILTRLPSQTLLIGDDIVIEVLGVEGQQVRLGLTAPSDITILRQELAERLARAEISTLQRRKQLP